MQIAYVKSSRIAQETSINKEVLHRTHTQPEGEETTPVRPLSSSIISCRMWKWAFAFAVVLLIHGAVAEEREEPAAKKKKGNCECVPYYLCESEATLDTEKCENYLEVCCESPTYLPTTEFPTRKKECGRRNPEGVGFHIKEVGENEALFGEFPWVVAVMRADPPDGEEASTQALKEYQCGGSLIHPKVVLTGAHCVAGKESHQIKIRAGELNKLDDIKLYDFQDRNVERIVAHENFKEGNLFNDVALLFLSEPVDSEEHIGFACLPAQGYLPSPGTRCFATGWGKDVFGKESQSHGTLKKIDLPVVANPECQAALRNTTLGRHFKLNESFMCAGGEQGKDTCKGDGGSPLVCPLPDNHEIYIQSGIVAWGIGCGENQTPGVYANVALFRNWIDGHMQEARLDPSYYTY